MSTNRLLGAALLLAFLAVTSVTPVRSAGPSNDPAKVAELAHAFAFTSAAVMRAHLEGKPVTEEIVRGAYYLEVKSVGAICAGNSKPGLRGVTPAYVALPAPHIERADSAAFNALLRAEIPPMPRTGAKDCTNLAGGGSSTLGLKSDGTIVAWGDDTYGQSTVPDPNAGHVAVEGGVSHSLGLKYDGTIVAWGDNSQGQCNVPAPNADFVAVGGGLSHSIGLKSDGTIVAWGGNTYGQCDVPAPNADFVAVGSGREHSLAIRADGSVVAWGRDNFGQCDVPSPNSGFGAVSGGTAHSLGLKSDGTIVAWGGNGYGQCNVPAPNAGFMAVAAGGRHSLGLKSDGTIVAWGRNVEGQCNVPAPNGGFVDVAAGVNHSLGLKSDGTIVAWGSNASGQSEPPSGIAAADSLIMYLNGANVNQFVSDVRTNASYQTLRQDLLQMADCLNRAVPWYAALESQLEDPSDRMEITSEVIAAAADSIEAQGLPLYEVYIFQRAGLTPNEIASIGSFTARYLDQLSLEYQPVPLVQVLQQNANAFYRMSQSGSVAAWGQNDIHQCEPPSPNTDIVAVAGGNKHSLGLKSDGTIVCWGYNGYGQCNVPAPNANFVALAGGGYNSIGLKSDGTIICWGLNNYGQGNVPAPNADFTALAGGDAHSLGLKSDGTIVAWGRNNAGQCNVPAPNTGFVAVSAGQHHSLGLKSDGTIVAWGGNDYGQCNVPSPNTDFVGISAGLYHSLGLKSDGTIVAWGDNSHGECNVPVTSGYFVEIDAGYGHSMGLKSQGTIVCWGDNSLGQCNVGSPNSDYVTLAAGYRHSLGLRYPPLATIDVGDPFGVAEASPDRGMMLTIVPYPITNFADMTFTVRGAGPVTMTAFDATGREVVSSVLGSFAPGRHCVRWEPRGASGSRIPSGVYFLQVRSAGGEPSSTRVLLLR